MFEKKKQSESKNLVETPEYRSKGILCTECSNSEREGEISYLFTQSCPTLCNPMNCSTPGFPDLHYLPQLAQTHVHQIGDAIQPSRPLSSPFPPAFNPSQHQGLFQWVDSSHQVAKVLKLQFQHISMNISLNIQDWFLLGLIGLIYLQPKGLSRVFSNRIVQKHPIFWHSISFLAQLLSYDIPYMWNPKRIVAIELTKEKETHRLREWIYGCQGEGWEEGTVREFGMDMYTLLYLKWIANKDILYSTGSSTQCYVTAWMRGESGGE